STLPSRDRSSRLHPLVQGPRRVGEHRGRSLGEASAEGLVGEVANEADEPTDDGARGGSDGGADERARELSDETEPGPHAGPGDGALDHSLRDRALELAPGEVRFDVTVDARARVGEGLVDDPRLDGLGRRG